MVKRSRQRNVLVIGATGPIGKSLITQLQKQRYHVRAITREIGYRLKGVRILSGDLADFSFCLRALKGIDTVYYTASYRKNLEWHIREPWSFAQGNVTPLLNVLQAIERSNVKCFVYMSTIQVAYVDSGLGSVDGYAVGKSVNELLVRAFSQQHKHIRIKIVRSTAVYGPGDSFEPAIANLIPSLIRKVDKGRKSIEIWGKGTRKMQFIYVDDVVANLLAIAQDASEQFFVLGNPRAYSIRQLAEIVIKKFNKQLSITHNLAKPDKPTKIFSFRNKVKPKISLPEGIMRTITYYRNHHV